MVEELAFWGALGWGRDHQRHRGVTHTGEWLRSSYGEPWLWLKPVARVRVSAAVCLADEFEERERALNLLPFPIEAVQLPMYWGARHWVLKSPSGQLVELLEWAPAAHRYGPPVE